MSFTQSILIKVPVFIPPIPVIQPIPPQYSQYANLAGTVIQIDNYSGYPLIIHFPVEQWDYIMAPHEIHLQHALIQSEVSFTYAPAVSNIPFDSMQSFLVTYYAPGEVVPNVLPMIAPIADMPDSPSNLISQLISLASGANALFPGLTVVGGGNNLPVGSLVTVFLHTFFATPQTATIWGIWQVNAVTVTGVPAVNQTSELLRFSSPGFLNGTTASQNFIMNYQPPHPHKAQFLTQAADRTIQLQVVLLTSAGAVATGIEVSAGFSVVPFF